MTNALLMKATLCAAFLVVAYALAPADASRATSPIDISGDWNIEIAGYFEDSCLAKIFQDEDELILHSDCILTSSGYGLTGQIDRTSGSFEMANNPFHVLGVATKDGNAITGTWTAASVFTGTLEGTRKPPPVLEGAMAVDCDATTAGIQAACVYPVGERFTVGIDITEAPPSGYFGWQAKLRWSSQEVNYKPEPNPHDEVEWPYCDVPSRSINPPSIDPSILFACVPFPLPEQSLEYVGPVAIFEFWCNSVGLPAGVIKIQFDLVSRMGDLQWGTHFMDAGLESIDPALSGATLSCISDFDEDGCDAEQELGPNPLLGGGRSPNNFWDFFDTPGPGNVRDRAITSADIARVVQRFGTNDLGLGTFDRHSDPLSAPNSPVRPPGARGNYHPAFDRSPAPPKRSGPADGIIATGDVAMSVAQFGHSCATPGS